MKLLVLRIAASALCVACSSAPERPGHESEQGSGDGDAVGGGDGDGQLGELPDDFEECASDTVTAGLAKAANIVWVIDTSGSMDEEAALVQENMNQFAQSIVSAGLKDYRVVVISEREFVNVPEPLGSDEEHFLFVEEEVGSNEPLEKLVDLLGRYQSFLLPGAITHFVVVTDDESDLRATEFITRMSSDLDGTNFRVHAIASPPGATPPPAQGGNFWEDLVGDDDDTGCVGERGTAAAPGAEHYEAADATGGLTFSICESDWSGLFAELATEVGATATIPCELGIPQPEEGVDVNLDLVNLVLSDDKGTKVIPKAPAAISCQGTGWAYDNESNPSRIVLCAETCSAAAKAKTLEIALGCATTVL